MSSSPRVPASIGLVTEVLSAVRRKVHHGGVNQVGITVEGQRAYARGTDPAIPRLREWGRSGADFYLPYYTDLADGVWKHGAGNCDAQGMIAALLLAAKGAFPVDFMGVTIEYSKSGRKKSPAGHAFAVVGRRGSNDQLQYPERWNGAYVCDPWQGFAYPAHLIRERLWCGAFVPGPEPLAPRRGDTASFCSDGDQLAHFSVAARFERDSDVPPEVLKLWSGRA